MGLKISQMTAAVSLLGTEEIELSQLSTTIIITGTTISALASDNSFNDSALGFITAGFAVGQTVKIIGFTGNVANNIHSATITILTTGKMTIGGIDGDVIIDDAAGESVTITKWNTVKTSKNALIPSVGTPTVPVDFKDSCDAATTANTSLTGEKNIDGVITLASRILVKNQTAAAENGIYITDAAAWTRATDSDTSAELTSGTMVYVEGGTVNGNQVFILATPDPITLGSSALSFLSTAVPANTVVGKTVSGTAYTHVLTDSGKRLNATNAAAKTITIAPQASVNSAANTEIEIVNVGAGLLTIAPGAGVTINSAGGVLTLIQYQVARLKKRANPNTWDLTDIGVVSVDASGGLQTVSGSPITGTGTLRVAEAFNAQTGTSYTVLTGDRGKLATFSNAAAIAVTLPAAGASFPDGWFFDVQCVGAGTVTITPTTSTINGAATLVLHTGWSARIVSDGTNYRAILVERRDRVETLTYAATVTIDASLADNFRLVLTGNVILAAPINMRSGQVINVRIIQDATGSRLITWNAAFLFAGGTDPIASTAGNSRDFLSAQYDSTDATWYTSYMKGLA